MPLYVEKLEWSGCLTVYKVPDGVKRLRMWLTVSTEYRRVTDRQTDIQTDGQTSCYSIVRAVHNIARKNRDFLPISCFIWETVQDRGIAAMKYE